MSVTTLFGTELTVSISDDGVMIDNAMVTAADITTDNGVVHVINAVLIPDNSSSIEQSILNEDDTMLFKTDILGRVLDNNHSQKIIIEVYKSGKINKKYIIK